MAKVKGKSWDKLVKEYKLKPYRLKKGRRKTVLLVQIVRSSRLTYWYAHFTGNIYAVVIDDRINYRVMKANWLSNSDPTRAFSPTGEEGNLLIRRRDTKMIGRARVYG